MFECFTLSSQDPDLGIAAHSSTASHFVNIRIPALISDVHTLTAWKAQQQAAQ